MKSLALVEQILFTLIDEYLAERTDFGMFFRRFQEVYLDESPPVIRANRYALFAEVNQRGEDVLALVDEGTAIEAEIRTRSFRQWLAEARRSR